MKQLITRLSLILPVRVISEANSPQHWRLKNKRKLAQQEEVMIELANALKNRAVYFPCKVTLTRIGPKRLDPDNLANAFKGVQDAVAKVLRADDGDISKLRWVYGQEPIRKRQYSIRIDIAADIQPLEL